MGCPSGQSLVLKGKGGERLRCGLSLEELNISGVET